MKDSILDVRIVLILGTSLPKVYKFLTWKIGRNITGVGRILVLGRVKTWPPKGYLTLSDGGPGAKASRMVAKFKILKRLKY